MSDAVETEVATEPTEDEQTLDGENPDATTEDSDTFPRDYVESLRNEAKDHRHRAEAAEARVEELSRELFTARVAALGKLADPTDIAYSEDLLADPDKLTAAVDELLAQRPHYAARRAASVGQGLRDDNPGQFSLMDKLKGIG